MTEALMEPNNESPFPLRSIQVCQFRSCARSGTTQVLKEFQKYASPTLAVSGSGCLGQCGSGPTVVVMPDNIWYCRVKPQDVTTIMKAHIEQGHPVKRLLHPRIHPYFQE